jgi:hypothetical protein
MDRTETYEERTTSLEFAAGGSLGELIGGAGAVALTIIGLAGVFPVYMLTIATIACGAALLIEGGALSARFSRLLSELGAHGSYRSVEVGGGITAEFLGGVAAIVLGILGLLGINGLTLVPIAAVVLGTALLVSSGTTSRFTALALSQSKEHETFKKVATEAVYAAAGGQVLLGLGAIVLGILSLMGIQILTLSLVALLAVGTSTMLTGAAVGSRMLGALELR